MIAALAVFAQLSVVAHAPDSVGACDAFEVSVAVRSPGPVYPLLTAPSVAPFEILRSTTVPQVTRDPVAGTILAEFRYLLATEQTGTFMIPPFEASLRGQVVRSQPVRVVVHSRSGRNAPAVVARARIDTSLDVNFRALTVPETVFVGQQTNYEVAVFLNQSVRDRMRRNPTFFPPEMQSMLAYDLPVRGDPPRRRAGSRCFDALVYQRALFPLMPGRFVIPPAQLVYSLPVSAGFFSREETRELQTDSAVIVAVEPPLRGRPADFQGAVGNLRVSARVDSVGARVGDPVLLTVRVAGSGNVKLLPPPIVDIPWGTVVRGNERVEVDSAERRIRGAKEFDWVLTPRIAGELDLPPIRYSYFNPDSRRYETATSAQTRLSVAPGSLARLDTARSDHVLAVRTRYRGPLPPPWHERHALWLLLAAAPLPAVALRARARARREGPAAPPAAELQALARERSVPARAPEIRRTFVRASSARLGFEIGALTRAGSLTRALRRSGVSATVAAQAEELLRALDAASYSDQPALDRNAAARAIELFRRIDEEALPRGEIRRASFFAIALLGAGLAAGAGVVHATAGDPAHRAFDDGVTAYHGREFDAARAAFGRAAQLAPRSPDAWANFGTAAWAVSDTAGAVVGWQRALRLEPLAADVRTRTDLVHALPRQAAGFVPPLPLHGVVGAIVLAWLTAWALLALEAAGRLAGTRRTALALLVAAGGGGLAAIPLGERLSGRELAVARRTTALRAEPALAGVRGASMVTGEVVRVTGRSGAWARVRLDDTHHGWVDAALLLPLDARDIRTD